MEAAYLVQLIGESAEGETATSSENSPVYLEPLKILPRYSGERKLQSPFTLARRSTSAVDAAPIAQFCSENKTRRGGRGNWKIRGYAGRYISTGDRPWYFETQRAVRYFNGMNFTTGIDTRIDTNLVQQSDANSLGLLFEFTNGRRIVAYGNNACNALGSRSNDHCMMDKRYERNDEIIFGDVIVKLQ
ncbi:uncharacterized protein Y057_11540 [Fusarium fujikuroi]|nr:uncharacterized protein Y057_11540 [Fusarium fujikuroi]SCN79763.1 uncharacterized protein FFC1_03334 [Fusarium fujikuroi]